MPHMPPSRSNALGTDGPSWCPAVTAGPVGPVTWSERTGRPGRSARPLYTGGGRGGKR